MVLKKIYALLECEQFCQLLMAFEAENCVPNNSELSGYNKTLIEDLCSALAKGKLTGKDGILSSQTFGPGVLAYDFCLIY